MTNNEIVDSRWTIRFSNHADLAVSRNLARISARLVGVTIAGIVRTAIEEYCADRFGTELTKAMIEVTTSA